LQYYVQSWAGSGATWQGIGSTLGLVDYPTQNLVGELCMVRNAAGNPALAFTSYIVTGTPQGQSLGVSLFVP
jgi:hypothetical protein